MGRLITGGKILNIGEGNFGILKCVGKYWLLREGNSRNLKYWRVILKFCNLRGRAFLSIGSEMASRVTSISRATIALYIKLLSLPTEGKETVKVENVTLCDNATVAVATFDCKLPQV